MVRSFWKPLRASARARQRGFGLRRGVGPCAGSCPRFAVASTIAARLVTAASVVLLVACTAPESGAIPIEEPSRQPLAFSFAAPDGEELESTQLRGRVTIILLIATFDMASQLSARQANELLHTEKPRINVGAVVMEAPQYAELKATFQEAFELDYPVVMADHATLNGRGPFGQVVHIPTIIVLDPSGRERARLLGPVSMEQLREALDSARP